MSTARNVTANFTKPTPKLNVTIVGSGIASGSVIGTGGISCPGTCSVLYDPDTVVTLTATSNANAIFSGWNGSCGGSALTCTVTMDVSKSVTALFSLPTLTLSKKGVGSGSISGDVTCASASPSGTYLLSPGQSVTLTASPDNGSTFAGWSGACSGTGACTLTMSVPQFAQATFLFNGVSDAFPMGGNLPDGWVQPVGSSAPWVVGSDSAYEGSQSIRSGAITHGQRSEISYTGRFSATRVSFARRMSSEANSDFLEFYIDGVLKERWSGEVSWSVVSYPVTEGTHTFLWRYVKDGSASSGSDAAWIDNVSFLPGTSLSAILYLLLD